MPIALAFFVQYAYLIIFLWVLVEQMGIPIPSVPVLLTAGTLSATHRVSWIAISIAMLLACIAADTIWFLLGRRFGNSVLKLLCRFSFEASTCVSRTENYFTRRGPVTLLFAKFVPGLSTVAAKACFSRARDGSDDSGGIDLAHSLRVRIGHEKTAGGIERHAGGAH